MSRPFRNLALLVLGPILAAVAPSVAAQIQIFSTGGYGTPETISLAPSGFGSYGGRYFIPDAKLGQIWVVPAAGGPPTPFLAPELGFGVTVGGIFLPSNWGTNSGKFLTAGFTGMLVVDSSGIPTSFGSLQGLLTTPLIAPAGFGSYGGHLFVSDQNGFIWRADPAGGGLTQFMNFKGGPFEGGPFALEFTPPGFGSAESRLMVSDSPVGSIVALAADGTASLFKAVPLAIGQGGLRHMLMTPDSFLSSLGIPGPLLLVSVTGSDESGGALGALLALDPSGAIRAHLKVGVLAKFDPRGMVFTGDGHLLISDASDSILKASALDFAPGRCQPTVASAVSTSSLWPSNHNLVNVGLSATVTDACAVTSEVLVFSDEDDQAETGDGNFSPDARDIALGTLRLRAERNTKGDGRVYLVVVKATDAENVAVSCNTVVVPKDQTKAAKSSVEAQASAASAFCLAHAGAPPPGYFAIGDGPVIGPRQ